MTNPSLALTMGEPAGIGGQLTLKAWKLRRSQGPAFIAIDNVERLNKEMERLGIYTPLETTTDPCEVEKIFPHALPVFDIPLGKIPKPGEPITETAPAILPPGFILCIPAVSVRHRHGNFHWLDFS